jgi:hypothetical protein
MSLDVPKSRVPSNPSDTNADQFIHSVTVDIANMSLDPPLAEFTLFPKLPIELRLKTFGYALPDGGRTAIRARVVLKGDRGSFKKRLQFEVRKISGKATRNTPSSLLQLGLLGACKESRETYIQSFKNVLPSPRGLIRFHDDTIIYIENFGFLAEQRAEQRGMLRAVRFNHPLPDRLLAIKNVIVKVDCFWPGSPAARA